MDVALAESHEGEGEGETGETDTAAYAREMRNWRDRAMSDVKAGRPIRPFVPHAIATDDYERMDAHIRACETPDEIRALFRRVKDGGPGALEEVSV